MNQYWSLHSLPKSILERYQLAEYGRTLRLQSPGATRWDSEKLAAEMLLKTQDAMETAVADAVFKRECLVSGNFEQPKPAADAALAVRAPTTGSSC